MEMQPLDYVIVALIFLYVVFALLHIVLALITAKKNTYATEVGLDKIKFVNKGKDPFKILANLKDAGVNKEGKIVAKGERGYTWGMGLRNKIGPYINPINILLRVIFGIWWVSFLYPQRRLHSFIIDDIHRYHEAPQGATLESTIEYQKTKEVFELYRLLERPYYQQLTLGQDGSQIEVVTMAECTVIDPVLAAQSLSGKFFRRLDPGILGLIEDWANRMDYSSVLNTKTGKHEDLWQLAQGSPGVRSLNALLIESCGIALTDLYFKALRPIGKLAAASEKKAIAKINAEVTEIDARAEARKTIRLAAASARKYTDPIRGMRKLGVNPNVAARANERVQVFENLRHPDAKLITLVEGDSSDKGNKPGVVLPPTPPPTPPSTPPTT